MVSISRYTAITIMLAITLFASAAAAAPAKGSIVIGIAPELNLVRQMERFVPLCNYLAKKTGLAVDVKPLSNYGHLYEEMRDGNIDAGFFGSFVYVMTRARLGIEPLARPVLPGGKSTYTGLTFVRRDSNINSPADMKGKTIALVDPATTGGYLAQKAFLQHLGIKMDSDLKIYWAGSHEAAIRAVLSNQAEIGGAKDTVVRKFQRENRVFDAVVEVVNETPRKGVPDNTLAVRRGLNPVIREKLKKALLQMSNDHEGRIVLAKFGAMKFIPTVDEDFRPLYDMVKQQKIDLLKYPYKKPAQW